MVLISERPAEVEDRAVPGHWEGDLITGRENESAIGTLVERTTGFVILLHLPGRHGAPQVQDAMIAAMRTLPEQLRKTVTWDQGIEMANHAQITVATDVEDLLLRPPLALAARLQREHQRSAAPVLPQGHRPVGLPPRLPRLRRRPAQRPAPQTTRLEDPQRGPPRTTVEPDKSRRCCASRLNPPGFDVSAATTLEGPAPQVTSSRSTVVRAPGPCRCRAPQRRAPATRT